ncbi:hypothetical protein ACPV5C_27470 [Vibrio owensii]|uniref:hypothetical protein n=1 Tax=Vibrio owensii TaxID=696485 RepID=UPI00406836AC
MIDYTGHIVSTSNKINNVTINLRAEPSTLDEVVGTKFEKVERLFSSAAGYWFLYKIKGNKRLIVYPSDL